MWRHKAMRRLVLVALLTCALFANAGGPRYVAGNTYFSPAAAGQPILWSGGKVSYFVDQGPLSSTVSNATATATVAAAATVWSAVPTAGVAITQGGSLAENVSRANVIVTATGITMPADIESTALATPVAIVFDADGSVTDAFYGLDASDPDDCMDSAVIPRVDNLSPAGNIVHALILVNGRCTGTPAQLEQIEFQLIRAFGRVLGLDWSQANDAVLFGVGYPSLQQLEGWPIMRPVDLDCNQLSFQCIPNPLQLRTDDIAAVSRLYPVTTANLGQFPTKTLTAAATVSIHGTISFRLGQGMQGVNVIARPITPGVALPDDRYPAASVSGFLYTGNRGNPVTGPTDPSGNSLSEYGSVDPIVEGFYDLSGIPLPAGETQADFEITLEPVNPLYTGNQSVGPYTLGSPTPSGTMLAANLFGVRAGMSIEQNFTIPDSADDLGPGSGGSASAPAALPPSGEWQSRIGSVGRAAWFAFSVQGGWHFTVETQALDFSDDESDEQGGVPAADTASETKLRPVAGIWNSVDSTTSPPALATIAPFNGAVPGLTSLGVDTVADGELILGVADQRGDGRPDYTLHGRLLYTSRVSPQNLPLTGGIITIAGSGFHPGMVVSLQSSLNPPILAVVTDVTPTILVATVPPASSASGSLDLVVTDPATHGIAAIAAGISYGDASTDMLTIVAAPPPMVATGVPSAFTVRAFGPDHITPVGGVPVTFSVLVGSANLSAGPGLSSIVTTTGGGFATVDVIATAIGAVTLQAYLSDGSVLLTRFIATATPAIASLTPPLFLAPNVTWSWSPQVELWNGVLPAAGAVVDWSGTGAHATVPLSSATNTEGVASIWLSVGPWPAGTSFTLTACIPATTSCVAIPVYTVHPETELLSSVSGVNQQLIPGQTPAPVTVRLLAPGGQPIVGGTVTFTGALRAWTPPCSPVGPCPPGYLLSTFTQAVSTAADGSAAFTPVLNVTPEVLTGVAIAGASSTVPFQIEVHP